MKRQGHAGLRDAERALVRSRNVGAAAAAYTPIVSRLAEAFRELRAEDNFGERISHAVRDEQGPAGHAHRN